MHEDVVAAYWEQWRLRRGNREERVTAENAKDWPGGAVDDAVEAGQPSVVALLVALAEGAPSEEDAGLVGAGPLEDLLVVHDRRMAQPDGAALLDELDTSARRRACFRRALSSVWVGVEVPREVRQRLFRFFQTPPS